MILTIIGIALILVSLSLFLKSISLFFAAFEILWDRLFGQALLCLFSVLVLVGLSVLSLWFGLRVLFPVSEKEAVTEFIATMNSANEASLVVNRQTAYSVMSASDSDEMMGHYRAALEHAEKVDTALLDEKYDGWGTHFEKEFLVGLRLVVEGNTKVDAKKTMAGHRLMVAWGKWFEKNVSEIRKT